MKIRLMIKDDLYGAAQVHKATFVRQNYSYEWLECTLNAFPRHIIYVAEFEHQIIGYIIWSQKSGFRTEVVLELEQLAVSPTYQGKGVGRELIRSSLPLVKQQLATRKAVLKHVLVTTRADNYAQSLYKSTLGAEVEVTISDLYSADEVLMIARNVG